MHTSADPRWVRTTMALAEDLVAHDQVVEMLSAVCVFITNLATGCHGYEVAIAASPVSCRSGGRPQSRRCQSDHAGYDQRDADAEPDVRGLLCINGLPPEYQLAEDATAMADREGARNRQPRGHERPATSLSAHFWNGSDSRCRLNNS